MKKSTIERFYKKSKENHGDKFDYSHSVFSGSKDKIVIICKTCNNAFLQTPDRHMAGDGCVYCSGKYQRNTLGFIKDAMQVHGFAFDYSDSVYVDMHTKVKIKHNKCGHIFEVKPGNHILRKSGCPKCSGGVKITKEEFVDRAVKVHESKYDYSNVEYVNSGTKVKIFCNDCKNLFLQKPYHHIGGAGCSICCESRGEREIARFLTSQQVDFVRQYGPDGCISIKQLYFDFYLPMHNILIEYDGEQHYKAIPHFGGENKFKKLIKRDKIKSNWSVSNNIKLYRIKYNDDLVLELRNILNMEII